VTETAAQVTTETSCLMYITIYTTGNDGKRKCSTNGGERKDDKAVS